MQRNFTSISSQLADGPKELEDKFGEKIKKCRSKIAKLEAALADIENRRVQLAKYFCEEEKTFLIEDCTIIFSTLCHKIKEVQEVTHIIEMLLFSIFT